MNELCILFLNHANDRITQKHLALIKEKHPSVPVVPLTFGRGVAGSIQVPAKLPLIDRTEWRNCDQLVYHWFRSPEKIDAQRYLILEWDCLCSAAAVDFFSEAWDKPATGARILCGPATIPAAWGNTTGVKFFAISPINGILLSKLALAAISELAQNPIYGHLISDARIGSLLALSGFEPVKSFSGIEGYNSPSLKTPIGAGFWHSVKS